MNSLLLKSIIVRNGDTQRDLSDFLGISLSVLNAKINGVRSFRQDEILAIKNKYGLTANEVDSIFLLNHCPKKTITFERRKQNAKRKIRLP